MSTVDILLKDAELESLIASFENKINEINNKFDEIKSKTSIVDGESETWKSKSQQAFKAKKDLYIKQFAPIIEELTKELNLLKLARTKLNATESSINSNIDNLISEVV
ncbi:MAG: hypothetical protein PHD02_02580 [Bacilli bacterium]|nr:hypothetical protein [Bacilli bacterium]